MMEQMVFAVSSLMTCRLASGSRSSTRLPLASSTLLTRCGCTRSPPLAMVATAVTIWMGVILLDCPNEQLANCTGPRPSAV